MAISSHDADKFRLKHAEELLALFEEARGHPALQLMNLRDG
jgi:hypothetical protein